MLARKQERILVKVVITVFCLALVSLGTVGASSATAAELESYTNSIGMEFVLIPAGSFTIRNGPKAVISKPFYLGKYEVTQEQWVAVLGNRVYRRAPAGPTGGWYSDNNPAQFRGPDKPVDTVSWEDAQMFIKLLNAKEGHNRYRLPTSLEWELAARGGTATERFFTDGRLEDYSWFRDNSGNTTHPVGQKRPNPYGLYDIYGNVSEWVQDWYYTGCPPGREIKDYRGPESDLGTRRMLRGGSYESYSDRCSSVFKDGAYIHWRLNSIGFRLVLSPE